LGKRVLGLDERKDNEDKDDDDDDDDGAMKQ
jgi:hypothetical protein